MKKYLLLICVFGLFFSSCNKSKEEKAEALIKDKVIASLYHPDTYKPVSTHVDSCFWNRDNLPKFIQILDELTKLLSKQEEYTKDMEEEHFTMGIFSPNRYYASEYEISKYNDAKKKYNLLKGKLDKTNAKISSKYKELKQVVQHIYADKPTGWLIRHQFTSMNGDNTMSIKGEMIFFSDLDFSECGDGVSKENFEVISSFIQEIKDSESIDDLNDAYEALITQNTVL